MSFSIAQILKAITKFTSPKQAINAMLDKLPSDQANTFKTLINNGKNPKEELKELAQQGKVSPENIQEVKGLYKTAKMLGLKAKINIDELEEIVRTNYKQNGNNANVNNNNNNFSIF